MITHRYDYKALTRTKVDGKRLYATESGPLPSVTTILSRTKPERDRQALANWQKRVGKQEAQRITNEAANVGTLMHKYLEDWIKTDTYERKDSLIHRQAGSMADNVIEQISPDLGEIWGTEVNLYYPELYAGTTDLVGIWKEKQAIMDFKQSNKPKKKEWITDYFCQAVAYGAAHNILFDTNIQTAAIFVCTRDGEFQLFELDADEYEYYSKKWAQRLSDFYELDRY